MKHILTTCPSCQGILHIAALRCPSCGMELRNDFELSAFDRLNEKQYGFLLSFLRNRGNLKALQEEMGISYPYAKRQLDELLWALGLERIMEEEEGLTVDLQSIAADPDSHKASEIIKAKLKECGGHTTVRTYNGSTREVFISKSGRGISSPALPPQDYLFESFDALTDLLLSSPGYRAKKGSGRSARLGDPGCEETTAAGAYLRFIGKRPGEFGVDPTFILLAVMEWAGIIHNGRGEFWLTAEYLKKVGRL